MTSIFMECSFCSLYNIFHRVVLSDICFYMMSYSFKNIENSNFAAHHFRNLFTV